MKPSAKELAGSTLELPVAIVHQHPEKTSAEARSHLVGSALKDLVGLAVERDC